MERAPFGWNQPADFEDDWPVQSERTARIERLEQSEMLVQTDRVLASDSQADPARPAYTELPLNFERYHAAYEAEERWYAKATPKLGRDVRIAYVLFVVALAVAGVWVVQGYLQGPVAPEEASQTSNDPPRPRAAVPPSSELGPGTPVQGVDDSPDRTATADLPPASRVEPSLPGGSVDTPPTFEPPPLKGTTVDTAIQPEDPGIQTRKPTPPPVKRPLVIAPPPRPPYQATFGEPAAPPRPSTTDPAPAQAPAPASVPTPAVPRTPVGEPALASPATPPAAAVATPPPATAPPPAASTAAPSAPATAPTTTARTPAADVDSGAIRDVLGRYRNAFNARDAKAAQQVWPSVNERTLDRAFEQLEQQNVAFDTCTIYVKGVLAEANCRGTMRFVPRVGNRSTQVESRQWSFSLRKADSGGWLIQEVQEAQAR